MIGAIARPSLRVAAVIIVGVGLLAVRDAASAQKAGGWTAPADASRRTNPYATRSDAAAGGRKLFEQRCAACHGRDGQGTDKGPDLTATRAQSQPDGALFWKITQGNTREGMPTFSFLPEPQRWQLVLHLRALRETKSSAPQSSAESRCSGRPPMASVGATSFPRLATQGRWRRSAERLLLRPNRRLSETHTTCF